MPTHERRFFLGMLTKDLHKREEQLEKANEKAQNKATGKGSRTTKVGGNALKNKMKSGQIPTK